MADGTYIEGDGSGIALPDHPGGGGTLPVDVVRQWRRCRRCGRLTVHEAGTGCRPCAEGTEADRG